MQQRACPADLVGFRRTCRALLADVVAPADVTWRTPDSPSGSLFDDAAGRGADPGGQAADAAPSVPVPTAFLALCESAILHRDPDRFGLLYRLLWRLREEPALRHDPLDPDRLKAEHLARSVRRDMHKMKAFVRFRPIVDHAGGAFATVPAEARHVAWFEPGHHIVEAVAPFFARRFTQMRWAILTPECSVRWDGGQLEFGPGAGRDDAPPADAGEYLWLTYYENIFNPARLKLATMQREMPRRYWAGLPEARLIAPLAGTAAQRSWQMIATGPSEPTHRRPKAATPTGPDQAHPSSERPLTLADLGQAVDRCRECPIGAHATQGVAGNGPVRGARLMFVGEQPGDQEDLRGQPFVGPAGRLLDHAFAQLGWRRDTVYVTNAVKHFKFELRGKRRIHKTPAQQEAAACLHWRESEIELVQPEALVALGVTAARQLMGRTVPVMRERGHWLERDDGLRVLITLHPSALLRGDPAEKDAAFAAWLSDLRLADSYFR